MRCNVSTEGYIPSGAGGHLIMMESLTACRMLAEKLGHWPSYDEINEAYQEVLKRMLPEPDVEWLQKYPGKFIPEGD